jgi:hypothetical protein
MMQRTVSLQADMLKGFSPGAIWWREAKHNHARQRVTTPADITAAVVGVTSRVPTIGIQGVAQQEAHEMFVENTKPKERLAAMKPLKPSTTT